MDKKELILNDGNKIPLVGFGTYQALGQAGIDAVSYALLNGYRLLDTAAIYRNEAEVGQAIKASGIPRNEIFVTTKVWREHLGYKSTLKEFERSLRKLDLDYIDLYLIHWPANARNYTDWQKVNAATWKAMERLQAEGKVRSIGVSNFWQEHLEALFKTAHTIPAVNQIEFHPGYWQPELVAYCRARNIAIESWSPLARGKAFENDTLKRIATRHNTTAAKICLRWAIQHNVIAIPKSTTEDRIKENIAVFDFELSDAEMKEIDQLPEMGFSGELPAIWPERL